MISLRCILFNNHDIIEKKEYKDNNMIETTFVCSRCGKNENDIIKSYNLTSEKDFLKMLKKSI
jgi:non-homologous end joining protein Ku